MSTGRAPRTGMSGTVGRTAYTRYFVDGTPVLASIHVPRPQHVEVDFYLCTCAHGENQPNFFGPIAKL